MTFSAQDTRHMTSALALAREALFLTSPNPRVGCVIVGADDAVLGSGHTQRAGEGNEQLDEGEAVFGMCVFHWSSVVQHMPAAPLACAGCGCIAYPNGLQHGGAAGRDAFG